MKKLHKLLVYSLAITCLLWLCYSCNKSNPLSKNDVQSTAVSTDDPVQTSRVPLTKDQLIEIFYRNMKRDSLTLSEKYRKQNENARDGHEVCCSRATDVSGELVDRFYTSSGNVRVTYLLTFSESVCLSAPTITYNTFSLSSNSNVGTFIGATDLGPSLQLCSPTECIGWRGYSVTFELSSVDYCYYGPLTLTVNGSSWCRPFTVTTTLPRSLNYCNLPAIIGLSVFPQSTVEPTTGNVVISHECSCLCNHCYTDCPTAGTFNYRKIGTSAWSSQSISSASVTTNINNLPSGNYEYEATLNYSSCTSQVKSGTFIVP